MTAAGIVFIFKCRMSTGRVFPGARAKNPPAGRPSLPADGSIRRARYLNSAISQTSAAVMCEWRGQSPPGHAHITRQCRYSIVFVLRTLLLFFLVTFVRPGPRLAPAAFCPRIHPAARTATPVYVLDTLLSSPIDIAHNTYCLAHQLCCFT